MKQSPIFSKTYDLLKWLIPATVKFPRQHRFVLAQAIQQDALHFQGFIIEAVHSPHPIHKLSAADAELDKLRTHIRLARDLGLLSPSQYKHVARILTEIGKLLGGWKNSITQ